MFKNSQLAIQHFHHRFVGMCKVKKGEIARAKQNHLGFWLLAQEDNELENLFRRVDDEQYLNEEERKRLKTLQDQTYYDSLFDCEE